MFNVAVVAAAAAGGRFTPPQPTLTHSGNGVFVISPYDSRLDYTLSNGSAQRSGNQVTLPSSSMSTDIVAVNPKGRIESTPRFLERKPFAYTPDTRYTVHENRGECGPGPDCSCHPGWGPHWDTNNLGQSVNAHCSRDVQYGSAPQLISETGNGYTSSNGEWIKNQ